MCPELGGRLALKRARSRFYGLHLLLFVLIVALYPLNAQAQSRARSPKSTRPQDILQSLRSVGPRPPHVFYPPNMSKLPDWVLKTRWTGEGRAPGDQNVVRQTILLTKANPNLPFSNVPATSSNEHPFWTSDEKYIYFDSNRNSSTDSTPNATNTYNIFRMFPDGTGVTQVIPANINQIEPAVSRDGSQLAFVGGGTFVSGAGTAHPVTTGFNLYLYNLNQGGAATPVTNTTAGFTFADVRHPTWSPGGDAIAFAGQLQGQNVYHIFLYTLANGVITQLTTGASNDTSPAWSPDGHFIAFSTNASGFASGAAPVVAAGTVSNYDIWVITTNLNALQATRITNFAVGGQQSNNYNPAWSSLNIDPLGIIPIQPNPSNNGLTQSELMIAFASDREDTNNDGIANAINPNHSTDIYWVQTPEQSPATGVVTIAGESSGNPAHKLQTSQPDTAMDPSEPSYNFDKSHVSNEDFPTWPQYKNSYRIVFQSDRGGTLEIWGSTIIDIDAPALLKYDASTNEIVHLEKEVGTHTGISQRQFNPGDTVRICVRAVDYESGVNSVYVQIKCPNAMQQSPDNMEHRIFNIGGGAVGGSGTSVQSIFNAGSGGFPIEEDYQAVNANGPMTGGVPQFRPFNTPNLYTPGVDDLDAFSGAAHPPDRFWLQLYDDGPTTQGGHEPPGEVAGDGVYTADWTTPVNFPSDWVIDVIIYNNAVDPFNPQKRSDWRIYDNVWGFTTQPFQALHNVLYVDDYDSGQKFFSNRFGSGNFQASNTTGFNGIPTESYMTEFTPALFPDTYQAGTGQPSPLLDFMNTLGPQSYGANVGDGAYYDPLDDDGSGVPPTQSYDIWRIQCRGPIPQSVLNAYLPYYENIPPDPSNTNLPTKVLVAEKCVLWHSPYSGDLFVGPGTILDQQTQTMLANFVQAGGRLFINGQDIAWGLTLGGTQQNSFLSNVLYCNYVADAANTDQINLQGARGSAPIAWETWYGGVHRYPPYPPMDTPNNPPGNNSPIYIGPILNQAYTAAAHDTWDDTTVPVLIGFNDVVTFNPPSTVQSGVDGVYSNGAGPAIMWYANPTTGGRVVYSPFGWEGIVPKTIALQGNPTPYLCINLRMELIHNVLDFLRTGYIYGSVRSYNGGAAVPLANVLVRAFDAQGNEVSTALTQADGSYILRGLYPNGIYALDAIAPGYVTQHATGIEFHGGYGVRNDFFMSQAQPGVISGKITDAVTGLPVPNITVEALDISGAAPANTFFTGVSAPDGTYFIKNVPASSYEVFPILPAQGYVSSNPANYGAPPGQPVVVAPSQTVSGKDFQLIQAPGTITGKVDIADANGNDTGQPLPGATITATSTSNSQTQFVSAPPTGGSQNDGTFTIPNVSPGQYSVTATAPGYNLVKSVTVTVTTQQTTSGVLLLMSPVPPGSISGLVATSLGIPVGGATITVTNSAGTVVATGTSGAVQTTTINGQTYTYNYKITNVPAGATVTVSASKAGYTTKTSAQTVTVTSNQETQNVNFTLDPLAAFGPNLALVSSPYYFTTDGNPASPPLDVATLLGVPSSDVSSGAFQFTYWNASTQSYVNYPTPPANAFRLGLGYFLRDTDTATVMAITNPNGITAPKDANGNFLPFNIPLQQGWNMIGDPFTSSVNFNGLQVQLQNGTLINVTAAQAGPNPVLGAALWTYQNGNYAVVYTLDPFRGYWLYAFQPCTLVVTPSAQQGRGAFSAAGRALEFTSGGNGNWKLDIVAATDQSNSKATIGVCNGATDQYDRYKMLTPPALGRNAVVLGIDHSDWGRQAGLYSVDVRSAAATTWKFVLQANTGGQPVTLTWPNLAMAGKHDFIFTDLDNGTSFELHDRSSYTVTIGQGTTTHHFEIDVLRATRSPLQILNVTALMNTNRATGQSDSATISYTLTTAAKMVVRILNNGRVVRTLEANTTRAAGTNQVVWDLKSDSGIRVPTGVYQAQVIATDANGHQVPRVVPLVITR
ncbi:periplasmic component of the Tol biopolymer transport system [Chthonomonas calidirosea]|uniref:carboxypeptidase regulatory-like domain-containing protein n=1 Tax=Chthonomonas calidirosea TaxID=454171 RepID=UPI0006DD4218|nr:carboxypeptidase regulatory-like domain-containing protein [Chthonomonas calidirosea]CEK16366.1 periplasmic component of the Tol biopolymer transport system [Chthonomonas calidirosea]